MDFFKDRLEFDRQRELVVVVPASEMLCNPRQVVEVWPEECAADELFLEQIETHAKHARSINEIIDCLPEPTMSIEAALETGVLGEAQTERFYTTLNNILENQEYARLALYVPFAWLPDASWAPKNPALQHTVDRFKEAYLAAWHNLLSVQDVRANFIDGDVLESDQESGQFDRVVKVAHLIPALIERRLVSEATVIALLDEAENPILKRSILEGLAAYAPSRHEAPLLPPKEQPQTEITERRKWWLALVEREALITAAAEEITTAIIENRLPDEIIEDVETTSGDTVPNHAFIEGAYRAIESVSAGDRQQATTLYECFEPTLTTLWERGNHGLTDRLTSTFRRLHRLGLVSQTQLAELGVTLPNLTGPWSDNLSLLPEAVNGAKHIVAAIESHPELRELLLPVVMMGGSQLKGYGESGSDIDIAIFIKPGVSESLQTHIRELLEPMVDPGLRFEMTDFWLENTGKDRLRIRDFAERDRHTGDTSANHVLFGAAWIGGEAAITELQRKLLPCYFHTPDESRDKQLARARYLEKIEQDALQYRLLHRGYARQYPLVKRPASSYSDAVDGRSTFWDPGYRQVAARLFINTVFLPRLKKLA